MSGFLDNIDRLQKTLQDLQPLKPEDQERLDKKFRLEFNYNSNHIEGNTLTYGETKLLLLFDDVKGNHTLREYEEMKSHDVAYKLIEEWAADTERPLSENKIKELNQILLVRPYWKEAITPDGQPTRREIKVGEYKQYPNSVRLENGEIFHYASPVDTPIKMQELIDWYRDEEGKMHPVQLAAMLHYKFVSIHPFDDGNGRISRLLVNYVLIKNGLPPIVIKSSDKANYLRALHLADVGDIDAFVRYVSEQVIWSLQISIAAAKGEDIEEKNDWKKKLSLLKNEFAGGAKEVTIKKDATSIKHLFETSLVPLIMSWEEKLLSMDPLFISRKNRLVFSKNELESFNGWNFITDTANINEDFFKKIFAQKNPVVTFSSNFKGFRNIDNSISFNGGDISVRLLDNSYELMHTHLGNPTNRLYSQQLALEDIESIVNILGRYFIIELDNYLNSQN